MRRMDRRGFLKLASLVGAGAVASAIPLTRRAEGQEAQYYLVTGSPDRDLARLLDHLEIRRSSVRITTSPITATNQDLSIILGGEVVDPVRGNQGNRKLKDMALRLRERSDLGPTLLTVTPWESRENNLVTFEVNGKVEDQLPLNRDFESIIISGSHGDTEFQIKQGIVSVTHSSCKNQVCRSMSGITNGRIICAPNKLVASVRNTGFAVDSITG